MMSDLNDPIFEHERLELPPTLEYRPESVIPVVVGAHPKGEIIDRPWAGRMARSIRQTLRDRGLDSPDGPTPLVVTDVWYLNDDQLRLQPTIAIGDPAVNAASAMFANRLPCAFAIENTCQVLLDPEMLEPRACFWGVNDESIRLAWERFQSKWLEEFLDAAEHVCKA
jgi:hypothetical protein